MAITYRTISGQVITIDASNNSITNRNNDFIASGVAGDKGTDDRVGTAQEREDIITELLQASEGGFDGRDIKLSDLLGSVELKSDIKDDDSNGLADEIGRLKQKLAALLNAKDNLEGQKSAVDGELAAARAELDAADKMPNGTTAEKAEKTAAQTAAKAKQAELNEKKQSLENALGQTTKLLDSLTQKAKSAQATATAEKNGAPLSAAETAALNDLAAFLEQKIPTTPAQKPGTTPPNGGAAATTPTPQPQQAGGPGSPWGMPQAAYAPAGGGMAGLTMPADQMMAGLMADMNSGAMDEIFKTKAQGDKMMQLLMYLSRMASSGDLGAMYLFLRVIATIVTKDKANQNIALGDKMLKLQADSREVTNRLMEADAYDKTDPGVAAEFSKTMESTRADQGALANSQKLIGGMLEEMTQVSEMMTNMIKSMLDARGRELQMVSSWR